LSVHQMYPVFIYISCPGNLLTFTPTSGKNRFI
jgi:hypothetical protein